MGEERSRVLEIKYTNANEDTFTLDIPDYDVEKPDAELAAVGKNILTLDVFEPNGFPLVKLESMTKVVTTETPVNIDEAA